VKISVARDELFAQLGMVSRVASTRSAVQALSGVQLAASGSGGVELRATDMEMGLRVPLKAEVEREGTVVLPARLAVDVVRALPAAQVSLEVRAVEQDVEIVSRAASRDETRPVLTGILVSAADRELRMVATDSYRLSVKETALESPLESSFEANVPARALQELARISQASAEEHLSVGVRQNQVVFGMGGVVLSSRLIDGQFPNYRQLLPDSYEHELTLAGAELTAVVRRMSLLAQRNAPLRLAFSPGELTVSAQTPDVGEARESLPVRFEGEPLEIGFNPEFLRDGLESVESGDITLGLISPLRPGIIRAADGSGFQYLIMPIRLNV